MKGLEPSRLAALVPKTSVYTNFTTSPRRDKLSASSTDKIISVVSAFRYPSSKNCKRVSVACSFFKPCSSYIS